MEIWKVEEEVCETGKVEELEEVGSLWKVGVVGDFI